MRKALELERLAQVARQQASLTTDPATVDVLLDVARRFSNEARDRRARLDLEKPPEVSPPAPDDGNVLQQGGAAEQLDGALDRIS